MLLLPLLASCVNRTAPAYTWTWTDEAPMAGIPDLVAGEVVAVFAGDAGKHHPGGALVDGNCTPPDQDAVTLAMVRDVSDEASVFWLGDNVYEKGWDPGKPIGSCESGDPGAPAKGMAALDRQIGGAHDPDHAYFVPGNHDYAQGGLRQRERIEAQATYLRDRGAHAVAYDKPVEAVRLGGVTVVAYDSQWAVLQPEDRASMLAEMDRIVQKASARRDLVVIASHHPLYTVGPHGFSGLRGSLTSTDLSNRLYASWREQLREALQGWGTKVDLTVAGHEHSLQLFRTPDTLHLVAGAAAKSSPVRGGSSDHVALEHAESTLGYALLTAFEGRFAIELIGIRRSDGPGCAELAEGWWRCRVAHAWLRERVPDEAAPAIPMLSDG